MDRVGAAHYSQDTVTLTTISARGWLVPIGGCMKSPEILTRFIDLCGGAEARIVVIPTASNEPDCRSYYEGVFAPFQQQALEVLPVVTRADASNPELLAHIAAATGVFFTGGNQLKLATVLGGTPMAEALRARFAAGMTVGGTSAGAAFLSDHMIAFGEEGKTPRTAMVTTVAGLGLTKRFIIDQHFRQRDRLGRLVTAIAYNPVMIGLGVDEDTAAFISPDEDTIHIVGTGAVTVVDPAELDTSAILEAVPGTHRDLPGMVVHVLHAGSVYESGEPSAAA
jgi:cyanophycinase